MTRIRWVVVAITAVLLISLSASSLAADTDQVWRNTLKAGTKILAGIVAQEAGVAVVEIADRLGVLDLAIDAFSSLLGLNKPPKLITSNIGITITGEEAKKALLQMGANINPDVDPSTLQVVAVEGLGVYTIDELIEAGWTRRSDGTWIKGEHGRDLVPKEVGKDLVDLHATMKVINGPVVVSINQDFPITVEWTVELYVAGRKVDTKQGRNTITIPGSNHPVPKCSNEYTFQINTPYGPLQNTYIYRSNASAASLSTDGLLPQDALRCFEDKQGTLAVTEQKKKVYPTSDGAWAEQELPKTNPVVFLFNNPYAPDATGDQPNVQQDPINSNRPSWPGGSGGGGGFSGLSGLSGLGSISAADLKVALDNLQKYGNMAIEDESDRAAFNAIMAQEYQRLQNATPEQRYEMVFRLMSYEETIRDKKYTTGELAKVLSQRQSSVIPGDPVSLLSQKVWAEANTSQIEAILHEFFRAYTR